MSWLNSQSKKFDWTEEIEGVEVTRFVWTESTVEINVAAGFHVLLYKFNVETLKYLSVLIGGKTWSVFRPPQWPTEQWKQLNLRDISTAYRATLFLQETLPTGV